MFPYILFLIIPFIKCDSHYEDPSNRSWSIIFREVYDLANQIPNKKVAVACPEEPSILETVSMANRLKIAEFILIGDENNIKTLSKEHNYKIDDIKIINEPNKALAALKATKLVHDGEYDILMRGYVPISDFMNAVKDKNVGLNTGKLISYIVMTEIQGIDQLLFLTDGEIITNPSLEDKVHLIENAVEMARLFGIRHPNVAALSPIEYIDPNVKSSVEADMLKKMSDEGKIKNCLIEGPISMDMAISYQACVDKAAWGSRIKGNANILLFPDYMASNMSWRLVRYVKRHLAAMLLWGTSKPVVMTGRGDDVWTKINSIVIAKYIDEYLKGNLNERNMYVMNVG